MALTVLGWIGVFIAGLFALALAGVIVFVGSAVIAGFREVRKIVRESQRG